MLDISPLGTNNGGAFTGSMLCTGLPKKLWMYHIWFRYLQTRIKGKLYISFKLTFFKSPRKTRKSPSKTALGG